MSRNAPVGALGKQRSPHTPRRPLAPVPAPAPVRCLPGLRFASPYGNMAAPLSADSGAARRAVTRQTTANRRGTRRRAALALGGSGASRQQPRRAAPGVSVGGGRSLAGPPWTQVGPGRALPAARRPRFPSALPSPAAAPGPRFPGAASLTGGRECAAFRPGHGPGSRGPPGPGRPSGGAEGKPVAAGVGRRRAASPSCPPQPRCCRRSSKARGFAAGPGLPGGEAERGAVTGLVSLCPAPRGGSRGEKAARR